MIHDVVCNNQGRPVGPVVLRLGAKKAVANDELDLTMFHDAIVGYLGDGTTELPDIHRGMLDTVTTLRAS